MTDVPIRVSSKWARHLFACSLEYIKSTCHGRCCQGTDCIKVALTEYEQRREVGYATENGLLVPHPDTGLCPHKLPDGLCALHGSQRKFLGCRVSPFKVNASGTVIIRHRYVQMKCHGHGRPAYQVFNASLVAMFGETEAGRITSLLDGGSGDVDAIMPGAIAKALHELEGEA